MFFSSPRRTIFLGLIVGLANGAASHAQTLHQQVEQMRTPAVNEIIGGVAQFEPAPHIDRVLAHASNYGELGRDADDITSIVIRGFNGDLERVIARTQRANSGVAAHFLVDSIGGITQNVPLTAQVLHLRQFGPAVVVIWVQNNGDDSYEDRGLQATIELVRYLCQRLGIRRVQPRVNRPILPSTPGIFSDSHTDHHPEWSLFEFSAINAMNYLVQAIVVPPAPTRGLPQHNAVFAPSPVTLTWAATGDSDYDVMTNNQSGTLAGTTLLPASVRTIFYALEVERWDPVAQTWVDVRMGRPHELRYPQIRGTYYPTLARFTVPARALQQGWFRWRVAAKNAYDYSDFWEYPPNSISSSHFFVIDYTRPPGQVNIFPPDGPLEFERPGTLSVGFELRPAIEGVVDDYEVTLTNTTTNELVGNGRATLISGPPATGRRVFRVATSGDYLARVVARKHWVAGAPIARGAVPESVAEQLYRVVIEQ